MKLTKYEQETIINFNNDEQEASIYTASPQMMRKLDALAAAYPEHYQVVEQTEVSKTYSCEKHLINLRKPRKVNCSYKLCFIRNDDQRETESLWNRPISKTCRCACTIAFATDRPIPDPPVPEFLFYL